MSNKLRGKATSLFKTALRIHVYLKLTINDAVSKPLQRGDNKSFGIFAMRSSDASIIIGPAILGLDYSTRACFVVKLSVNLIL